MKDIRGDIGFMEAMVAVMTVVVVLTAFTGAVTLKVVESDISPGYPDIHKMAKSLYVSENKLQGDLEEELEIILIKLNINGLYVSFTPVSDVNGNPVVEGRLQYTAGTQNGQLSTERVLCSVKKGEGSILVKGELKVWR